MYWTRFSSQICCCVSLRCAVDIKHTVKTAGNKQTWWESLCEHRCKLTMLPSWESDKPRHISPCFTLFSCVNSHSCNNQPQSQCLISRVSTNLINQISRRFSGDSRRDFKKNPGHVCLASASYAMNRCSLPRYRTKVCHAFYTTWGCSKHKIARPVS